MGRNILECWTVVLLVGASSLAAQATERKEVPPSAKQIAQWIQQLDDDLFSVRESASKRLRESGKAAIRAVATAALGDSIEVTDRAMRILEELGSSGQTATAQAAKEVLVELRASKHQAVAVRARRALAAYQQRIIVALEGCGAQVGTNEDKIISVNFDKAKVLGKNLRMLHELPDVEDLSFSTPLMDDDGLAALKGLRRVQNLNLFQSRVSDFGLKYLQTLPGLRSVPMGQTRVTDKGLIHLKDLTQLEYVGLRGNQVSDAGLVHLKKLTNLTGLYLGETKVTDSGLIHLQRLTKLNHLPLDHTQVSDAGLKHLMGLTELRDLDLSATRVTKTGVSRLQKSLPKARILLIPMPTDAVR